MVGHNLVNSAVYFHETNRYHLNRLLDRGLSDLALFDVA